MSLAVYTAKTNLSKCRYQFFSQMDTEKVVMLSMIIVCAGDGANARKKRTRQIGTKPRLLKMNVKSCFAGTVNSLLNPPGGLLISSTLEGAY